jgi:hypothetical protein
VSGAQLVEERLGLLQIERVEAFGEPANRKIGGGIRYIDCFEEASFRRRASSRSAVGRLIVNGKKPLDFRELAINFAHFQSHHRQQHDDAGQSHRKSNHMLNRCLHLLVLYRLAAAASNP